MAYANGKIPATALRRSTTGVSLRSDAAGKARHVIAHGVGIELADILISGKAEMFGKPCHRGGQHARLLRLVAHGEERHIARLVEHVTRSRLKLLRHRVEGLDDLICERAGLHRHRIHPSLMDCSICFIEV